MTNLEKILGSVRKATASWDAVFLRNINLGAEDEVKNKPYVKSTIVYTCISTTGRTIAQCPLIVMKKTNSRGGSKSELGIKALNRIYRRDKSQNNELVVLEQNSVGKGIFWEQVYEDAPWQKVFTRPNQIMSGSDLVEQIVNHLMLKGNVWALGLPFDPKVIPAQLWPIRRENIEAIKNSVGQLEGWKYRPNNSQTGVPIHIDELITHVGMFNPDDFIMGLSPLDAAELPLKGEYKAAQYNEKFFENSARPDGILSTDQHVPEPERAKIREQWKERHRGQSNAHEIAILHSGLKYQTTGLSQADMQYIEYRRWTRDEICQIFGTKKGVISITEDLNMATLMGQKSEWWESTLIPMIRKVENGFNLGLLKNNPSLKVVFDLSNVKALQEDMDNKATIAQRFWAMGVPFNQINEKLELGFDPMPWHDEGYLPFSVSSTNTPKIEPLEPEKPKEIAEETENEKGKSLIKSDDNKEWQAKAAESWKKITNSTNKIESNFEAKTSRLFLDIRKTILNILFTGEANKSKSLIVKELSKEELAKNIKKINAYNYKKEQEILKKFSQGYYEQSVKVGIDTLKNEIGIDIAFDLTDPIVVDFIKEKLVKVVGITDTIKNQLSVAIAEGMDEGETVKDIADRIREQFNFADKRARVIARTEVFGATNFGRNAAIQESGFKKKRWFTAKDDRVRPTHQEMHGESIDIDDDWEVGNSQLRFPADPSGDPSEIISCRCVETVILE